jgi:putative toxin-antitoxin system antitoxin component (TIGR02293 family)
MVHMSPHPGTAATELLRLFKGPRALRPGGRIAETSAVAYDIALHDMVERGLKATDLDGVSRVVGATPGAAAEVRRAIVPDSTWKRRKGKALSPTESDQTARLARTAAFALDTWDGDLESVRQFFARPHPELGGERPIDSMRTDSGTRLVEDILIRLRYGLPA